MAQSNFVHKTGFTSITRSAPQETNLTEFATLLQAIAAILWPVFAFSALFIFRSQIKDLAHRLKRGKLLGQEIELNESLSQLRESAVLAEGEVKALPLSPMPRLNASEQVIQDQVQRRIAAEAARSPHGALLMLSSELEILARQILAATGHMQNRKNMPFVSAMAELHKHFGLPDNVQIALDVFRSVRNRLLHKGEGTNDDILRAIDSGLVILRALAAIPREVNIVFDPGVAVYADPELTQPIEDIKGVILETLATDGVTKTLRIFPTTKTHFQKGRQVAWEWNMQVTVQPAWYRHPLTRESIEAWSAAAEFVGRHLDDL